ncbi:hypothetical protein NEUTE2DRAFT_77561 [Neurospora tetrasperma FGSC 2509]|nr:hypothetical protein NEUTE2DRAFT_77561 [Neurospora tetrasperma FGSC 2509]
MDFLSQTHHQTAVRRSSEMAHYQYPYHQMLQPEQFLSSNVEPQLMPSHFAFAPWQNADFAMATNTKLFLGNDDFSSAPIAHQRYAARTPSVSHSVGPRRVDATAAPLDNAIQTGSPWASADPTTPVGGETMTGYVPSPMGTFSSAASNTSFPLTPDAVNSVAGFDWQNPDIMTSPGVSFGVEAWSMRSSFDKGSTAETITIRSGLPHMATPPLLDDVAGVVDAEAFVSSPSYSQQSVEVAPSGVDSPLQTPGLDQSQPEKTESRKRGRKKTPESARKVCGQDNTTPVPASGRALRTAARKVVRFKSAQKPGESAEERRARVNHNQVEKQYRNRLHEYFDNLLKVLPDNPGMMEPKAEPENDDESQSSSSTSGRKSRNWSKAEVLERACHHIHELQNANAKLMQELETKRRESSASSASLPFSS